jgi:UDP-N-acetylglucosamine diphosphorylase/glucosamine-1-phosphate N-acetyltransferase
MDRVLVPFDDGQGDLGPLSDLRASFEQRSGGLSVLERCRLLGAVQGVVVPDAHAELASERAGVPANVGIDGAVLVNGRLHAGARWIAEHVLEVPEGGVLRSAEGGIVAARLSGTALESLVSAIRAGADPVPVLAGLPGRVLGDAHLWSRPWHLLHDRRFTDAIHGDASLVVAGWGTVVAPAAGTMVGNGAVHVHPTARLGIGVVFDTTAGDVVVGPAAEVRHGAVIHGPAFIGERCIVAERTLIKPRSAFGPQCRIAGEVGSVIFQAFANKAHDGHLGDALLGEWVNLGAGTVNSNLLNTYGEVAMRLRPESGLERTGRQFMGCIVGDHAKLAIGTRIMTGSSIGTGVMWAATSAISGAVARFAWVTDDGERRFILRKFMDVAHTVMARRGTQPGPACASRLAALHGEG